METKNYGLILEPIKIEQDYVFGGAPDLTIGGAPLQPDGQWLDFLPTNELQSQNGFEPSACASFGTLNALEILARRIYQQNRNWSDRYLATVSGTTTQGNSPQKVAEALRHLGVPNEVDWPYLASINTWAEFYAEIPQAIKSLAVAFLNEFNFLHEYVVTTPYYLKQALQHSPLGISVHAWIKGDDGLYYKPAGNLDNHWCVLVGYREGEYWLVFDSYEEAGNQVKKLRWDYAFQVAKRYSLERQIVSEKSWIQYLVELVRAAFGLTAPTSPVEVPQPSVPTDPTTPTPVAQPQAFKWGTQGEVWHSIRVMCDEAGLTWDTKNIVTACIYQESRFNPRAIGPTNSNGTTDYGLCQFNNGKNPKTGEPYWIGPGAAFTSVEEVLNDPEKNVRVMLNAVKNGQISLWSSYKTGAYKKWLDRVQFPFT